MNEIVKIETWERVLEEIGNSNHTLTTLNYKTKISYSYLSNIINELEDKNIIERIDNGKSNTLNITHKGKEMCHIIKVKRGLIE